MPTMNFILAGRDELSRILDRAGDASDRLARRLARLDRDSKAGGKALEELKKSALLLAPAAIPAAASLAPIAAGAGTVAVAVAAMGAALGPQIAALGDASEAQKKYDAAVKKSGPTSQEAVQAQMAYAQTMAALPPATREAAAAVGVLKDNYKQWSDSLAGDTMAPVTKGVAILNALLPKTTGLVKVTSAETDRFMTIVGGEMASPGLDALNSKFTSFAQKTLRGVNDEIVHLLHASQGKNLGGPARDFMDWAKAQGPTVASVLKSVATALVNVLHAGSDVGVGLLQVVDVIAKLVAAVPPGAIGAFLQLALALKLTKTAALGLAAGRTALVAFATQLVAMRTAAAGTTGSLAGARAGITALSRSAKVAVAGTGIGLLLLALSQLSQRGKQAPPDVDKLTSSLKQLGAAGKVTGEASRSFGKDLGGLYDKVRSLTDPSTTDKVQQFLVGWTGWDSTPVKDAKANIDAVDKALAGLVQGGQSDLAAAAVKRLTAEYGKGGRDTSKFTGSLNDYKDALSDSKFEQQLAADSMGLFGAQAQTVQAKLDAQKQSADGLRQSIQALNDANRAGLGGMIGFEAAIDAAATAATKNAGALSMSHGQLNLNSEKARNAASALQDLASKTDEAAASARQSGSSWATVNGIYARGRTALIKNAEAMGLTRAQAKTLADQILKIPNKTAKFKGDIEDLKAKLRTAKAELAKVPDSRKAQVRADIARLRAAIRQAKYELANLHDKTVTVYYQQVRNKGYSGNSATGGHRTGGPAPRFASGGMPTGLLSGPGTGTSDSLPMWWASTGEYIINARSTAKYLSLIEAINSDTLGSGRGMSGAGGAAAQGLASGMTGSTGVVNAAARAMAGAVTAGVREELQIASPSKKTKALAKDVGKGFIDGLTGSRDKIKSVSKDLAKDIWAAFTGSKDNRLVAMVNKDTKKLLDLAAKRDKIAAKITEAKAFASEITKNAREGASLSNLGMEPDTVTAGGIKAGLASKLAQIKQFTRYIDILAKKGLNKGLLRQILNMGPDAGYAYASALVGADKGTFKQINSLQSQLDKSTTSLGRLGADRMYDSGKNASKGFLEGLWSQERDLEKVMEKLAKSMQKSLKKALGIKSPARVMIPHGINTARGVAVGVLAGLPHVDRAMDTLAGRIAGRAASRPVAGRPAVMGAGSGGAPVYITVEGAVDPYAVARQLDKLLAKYRRGRGGAAYSFG